MRNIRQLNIWQKGFEVAINSLHLVNSFPKEEKFNLSSQITGSAVFISYNIAEGSSRSSHIDYNRFLEISLVSTFELGTQLLIT